MRYLFIVVALLALFASCVPSHAEPGAGNTPPFNGGAAPSPAPTGGSPNNVACATTPPSTIPFYQALVQPGLTQKGNGTCIPRHEFTEIGFDGSLCTTVCAYTSPPPTPDPPFNLGQYYINLYADFCEDGTSFTAGLCNEALEANYPYNVSNLGWFNNGAARTLGASHAMKYVNPNILHSNEQINPGIAPLGAGKQACNKPGTGIKFYGTPGNPNNLFNAIPPGMLGDPTPPANADTDIEHDGLGTARANDIYVTDNTSCKNTSPATPTPTQNYMAYLGSTHLQNWMASIQSGTTVSGVCAFSTCGSAASIFADIYFQYENDQSTTSIINQTTCNGSPCNPSGAQSTTQHWTTDQAMVNDRVTLFNAMLHQLGGSACENGPPCIPSGTGIAQQFNGLTNGIVGSNSCYLYMNGATGNYASTNTLQGEFEQPTSGFNGRIVEPRDWVHVLNCASEILSDTNGQIFFNDHQTLAANYQFYYDSFALKMLAYKAGYLSSALRLDDTPSGGSNTNPNLTVYPLQMLVPDPTANGSPTMTAFAPPASVHSRDANGYDGNFCPSVCGGNVANDANFGGGCDKWDASTDHGSADLLAATLSHSFGTVGCTGTGFASYVVPGSPNPCPGNTTSAQDYKCNPEGIYVREFANMYYNGSPITSAPISSAANYMAVVLNPTALVYQVQCADLPLEGGANYGHIVTATPSTPTQNSMDMVAGGSLAATTAFACGTASANLAAESSFILVK